MKSILLVLLLSAPAMAADGFTTVKEYQPDFDTAVQCKPVDGRKFWKGHQAYYLQSNLFYTSDSGALDKGSASVIAFKDVNPKLKKTFAEACR